MPEIVFFVEWHGFRNIRRKRSCQDSGWSFSRQLGMTWNEKKLKVVPGWIIHETRRKSKWIPLFSISSDDQWQLTWLANQSHQIHSGLCIKLARHPTQIRTVELPYEKRTPLHNTNCWIELEIDFYDGKMVWSDWMIKLESEMIHRGFPFKRTCFDSLSLLH